MKPAGGHFGSSADSHELLVKLEAAHAASPVTQQLGGEPKLLNDNAQNANAVANAIRLSAYHYPEAFAPEGEISQTATVIAAYQCSGTKVLAVGQGHALEAGAVFTYSPGMPWSWEGGTNTIDYLFRVRRNEPRLRNVGKRLLMAALSDFIDNSADHARLHVFSRNQAAYGLYEAIGFKVVESCAVEGDESNEVRVMELLTAQSLVEAHDILKAQL